MSALRLLWTDDALHHDDEAGDAPTILRFDPAHRASQKPRSNIIERARVLFANRECPSCRYPVVLPLELDDASINKSGLPIPGTATLVGFRCRGCQAEWSV
jgi:hypothetical protein